MGAMSELSREELCARWDALSAAEVASWGSSKWSQRHPDTGAPLLGAGVAEHDLGLPEPVQQMLTEQISHGTLGYLAPGAMEAHVRAFCGFAAARYGWQVDEGDVTITSDVLSVLRALILEVTEPGDAVVVPTPAYWVFRTIPKLLGRRLVDVPGARVDGRWALDTDAIAAAVDAGAKVVVLCNPWNPTGRVLTPAELDAFAQATLARGAWVFSDEIHAPLTLPGYTHVPFVSRNPDYGERTITATAASKALNIPGLKAAQTIITDPELAKRMRVPLTHASCCAATPGVLAGTIAYRDCGDWLDAARAYIADVLAEVRALTQGTGIVMDDPQGTYISLWDCREAAHADRPFATALDAGIMGNDGAAVGTGFGSYLRLNFGTGRAIAREIAQCTIEALTRD